MVIEIINSANLLDLVTGIDRRNVMDSVLLIACITNLKNSSQCERNQNNVR